MKKVIISLSLIIVGYSNANAQSSEEAYNQFPTDSTIHAILAQELPPNSSEEEKRTFETQKATLAWLINDTNRIFKFYDNQIKNNTLALEQLLGASPAIFEAEMPQHKAKQILSIAQRVQEKYPTVDSIQFAFTYFKSAYFASYGYNDSAEHYNKVLLSKYPNALERLQLTEATYENLINAQYQQNKIQAVKESIAAYVKQSKNANGVFTAIYNNRIGNYQENINNKNLSKSYLYDFIMSETYMEIKDTTNALKHYDKIYNKLEQSKHDETLQANEIFYYDDANSILEDLRVPYLNKMAAVYTAKDANKSCVIYNALHAAINAEKETDGHTSMMVNKYLLNKNFKDKINERLTPEALKQLSAQVNKKLATCK